MRRLLKYLKHYKKESIIGPLFKLLEATFELIVPVIMARIIDVGIRRNDVLYIGKMGLVLVGFGILGLACSLCAQYFAAKAAMGFGAELRYDLFKHIEGLSYAEVDRAGGSTLVVRMMSDTTQVQSGVNLVLRLFLRSPFIVIGALIMSFAINVKAALIFCVTVPLLALVIYVIMYLSIPLYKRVQRKLDRVQQSTRENLAGIRVVRAFRTQDEEKEEFARECDDLKGMQMKVGTISALMNPMTYVIVNAGILAIVWFGGVQVNVGDLTQGNVIALVNYMTQILLALVALANLIITFTKALASAGRITEVFTLEPSIKSGEKTADGQKSVTEKTAERQPEPSRMRDVQTEDVPQIPRVEMKHVDFVYAGDKEPVLHDLNFSIMAGETIGIIGGTGSGKTSLVNLIPRFYDVASGQVMMNGLDVREWNTDKLRERVGIIPQKAVLFHGTIRENMQMGKKDATDEEIYEALQTAQAEEVVAGKPDGLDTMISESGKNLSGGQRQRLTIARALVRKPEVLILDDSASALDFATDAKLRKAIAASTHDMTVFIVSQRASSIMQADRIIVLDDGQMAGYGSHSELLKTCEVYREICSSQLSKEEVERYA